MIMCHMWADSMPELMDMATAIGVQHRWLQKPPAASWVHFDISLKKKAMAIERGAILTDMFGPMEFLAKRDGNREALARIAHSRALRAKPPPPQGDLPL
jgi:hypothetical protein